MIGFKLNRTYSSEKRKSSIADASSSHMVLNESRSKHAEQPTVYYCSQSFYRHYFILLVLFFFSFFFLLSLLLPLLSPSLSLLLSPLMTVWLTALVHHYRITNITIITTVIIITDTLITIIPTTIDHLQKERDW